MEGYTNFTKVFAEVVRGTEIVGTVTGTASNASNLEGSINSSNELSKADNYSLSTVEKKKFFTALTMTAEDKVLTLGVNVGQSMIVYNTGVNSFTVKNIGDDTGTVLATTKAILIVGGVTSSANKSIVIALN